MDIELLRTFLEVHKTRHFGRAAENLYLTSAAISARVKQLEQQLGVTLFLRSRKSIQLTSAGDRLLPHAEAMILNWNRTLQELSLESSKSARLHIGATIGLWGASLQQKLTVLKRELADVAIQAEAHSEQELRRKLNDRTLDLVLLYEPPSTPELNSEKVGQLKLVMVSTEPDVSMRAALSSGYVYVDWGTAFSIFHANRLGDKAPAVLQVNLGSIALGYLAENRGAAFLPQSVLPQVTGLFPVKNAPVFSRPIHATYREGSSQSELIRDAIDLIRGVVI